MKRADKIDLFVVGCFVLFTFTVLAILAARSA